MSGKQKKIKNVEYFDKCHLPQATPSIKGKLDKIK